MKRCIEFPVDNESNKHIKDSMWSLVAADICRLFWCAFHTGNSFHLFEHIRDLR